MGWRAAAAAAAGNVSSRLSSKHVEKLPSSEAGYDPMGRDMWFVRSEDGEVVHRRDETRLTLSLPRVSLGNPFLLTWRSLVFCRAWERQSRCVPHPGRVARNVLEVCADV